MTRFEWSPGLAWDDATEYWNVRGGGHTLYSGFDEATARSVADYYTDTTGKQARIICSDVASAEELSELLRRFSH